MVDLSIAIEPERTGPQQQRSHETRALVLDAARELVRARGVRDFTLRDVARAAGKSPAVLYRYVKDKDDLLAILVDEMNLDICASVMRAAVEAPGDIAGGARAFLRTVLDLYRRDPALAGALLSLPPALGAARTPALPALVPDLVEAAIAARAPRSFIEATDMKGLARRVSVAVQAVILARHRAGSPSLEVLEDALVRLVVSAIGGGPAARVTSTDTAVVDGVFAVSARAPRRSDAQLGYEAACIAAAECVARDGVDVSTSVIAERAGVSPGSLFRWFPTKAALVAALAASVNDAFAARAVARLSGAATVGDAVDVVVDAAVEVLGARQRLVGALVPALARDGFFEPPPIPRALVDATCAAFARGSAFDDPALGAFTALHAGQALFLDALLRGLPLDEEAKPIRRMLRALVAGEPRC